MNYKTIAVIVLAAVYVYNLILSVISLRSMDNPIPDNVSDVYDQDTYLKWRAYHAESTRFEILTSTVTFVIVLILYGSSAMEVDADKLFVGTVPENVSIGLSEERQTCGEQLV